MQGSDVLSIFQLGVALNIAYSAYLYLFDTQISVYEENTQKLVAISEDKSRDRFERIQATIAYSEANADYNKYKISFFAKNVSKISLAGILLSCVSLVLLFFYTWNADSKYGFGTLILGGFVCFLPTSLAAYTAIQSVLLVGINNRMTDRESRPPAEMFDDDDDGENGEASSGSLA